MQVIVTKAQLDAKRACEYESSLAWVPERQALVYPDWDAAVERFLLSKDGITRLHFLVVNGLVPMTRKEFSDARRSARATLSAPQET